MINYSIPYSLLLDELIHFLLSGLVGFLFWLHFKDLRIFLVAFIFGFLIDIDHWFDYFAWFSSNGLKMNFKDFFDGATYFLASGKVYVPFHAWEWLIPLFFIGKLLGRKLKIKSLEWVIVSAYTLHLIWDQISVSPHPLGYFFFYRLANNFDLEVFNGI